MHKIKIIAVGKTKEPWLENALSEYQKRLKAQVQFEFLYPKDDVQLQTLAAKEPVCIPLDPSGTLYDSPGFAAFLFNRLEKGGARLAFAIGGPEGLPPALKNMESISLSPLTFTHQITRIVLLEQIYRAFEISRGSAYHK